jgi:hypothetical protein
MEEARQYLRSRKKYFIEQKNGWIPSKVAETDVAKTWAQYRIANGMLPIRVAK